MARTLTRDKIASLIAAECQSMIDDWQTGRSCSPAPLDYVIVADRLLTKHDPAYGGSVDVGREFLADVLDADMATKPELQSFDGIAKWLVEGLTAE